MSACLTVCSPCILWEQMLAVHPGVVSPIPTALLAPPGPAELWRAPVEERTGHTEPLCSHSQRDACGLFAALARPCLTGPVRKSFRMPGSPSQPR